MNPSSATVRLAEPGDVADIFHLLWDDDLGKDRENLSDVAMQSYRIAFDEIAKDANSSLLVAMDDGKVVGCLQLTMISGLSYQGIRRCLIEDVRVAKGQQGSGIGRLLMSKAEELAVTGGCRLMELFVHSDRIAAHRFYERQGYGGHHLGYRKKVG